MFHLMPYRDLPEDFGQRYNSAFIDPVWFDFADADKVGQYFNATLDELLYAANAGLHGVCTNQHHQNVYGFMANPSLMGSVLAKLTNGLNVAIVQLGSTLPSTTPPTRIAEEYAMLDCISGGRLVAGFPTGLPTDAAISNAVVPIEQRERFREALSLVIKAWSAKEVFAWNGKHYQLGMVNLWPRPIQQPHPPIWIGAGSPAGIRRAARLGDAWPITPQVKPADLPAQLGAFFDAREQAGRPRSGRQPLRREIMVGRDREDALARAVEVASPWYLNMARTGHHQYVDQEGLIASLPGVLAGHWVLGDAEDCARQLREIGAAVPVNPVITRANWPGMSPDESVAYLELLGEELIPALKDFDSVSSLA